MLPQSFLDDLIARNDIVDVVGSYVALQQKGSNLFGLCPFHNEKTPSFSVSPSKQIFHCFGCKKGGDVITFVKEIENLSYIEAVQFLAKRVNLEVPEDECYQSQYKEQERLWQLCKDAGLTMTNAGATYPYGKDPRDSNMRVAPSLPPIEQLQQAMEIYCTSLKLAALRKILEEKV